jgi:hypothetical protein
VSECLLSNKQFSSYIMVTCKLKINSSENQKLRNYVYFWFGLWFMVFNDTFNNILVISWRSVLLVEETWRKPLSCCKSLTNFITWCCIEYTSLWCCIEYTSLWCCIEYTSLWCCIEYTSLWCCIEYTSLWMGCILLTYCAFVVIWFLFNFVSFWLML